MAFRYALQTLLRLREGLERQEEQRLFAAAAVVSSLRAQLEQLQEDELRREREMQQEMIGGGSAELLRFADVCRAASLEVRKKLEFRLEEADRKRMERLQDYQAARQKREILAGLRQKQEAAYQLESARQEQQAADETFLIRGPARWADAEH